MPIYQFSAMDANGKERKGKREARSEEEVSSYLKEQGLFPTSIRLFTEKSTAAKKKGPADKKEGGISLNMQIGTPVIKKKQLTIVTRQLAILLDAGLPLIRSLRTLERQSRDVMVKTVLGKVAVSVESGATFSESLAQHPKSFDKLYLNMVRAGEAAGKMEIILDRLASFMEKAARIMGKVKSAMTYPCVVLGVALLITAGLMVFIVPKFEKIFADLLGKDTALPALTQVVIAISRWMQGNVLSLIGIIIGIVIAFKLAVKTKQGRYAVDYAKYKMPLFGPIVSKTAISKFSRTLGTLMGSGVPVLSALQIVRDTAGNELVSNAVQQVHDAVKEGEPMAAPLSATKIFPEMVISMIEVGEETGKLAEMLNKIADTYDEEVDNAVGSLTSMIEPLMMVFLAVVVGGIVIALFSPMIKIMEKMN